MEKDPIPRWTAQKRLVMSSRRFQSSGTRSARPFSLAPLTRDNAVTLLYKWLSVTVIDVTIEFFFSFLSFFLISSLFFFLAPLSIQPADDTYRRLLIRRQMNSEGRKIVSRFALIAMDGEGVSPWSLYERLRYEQRVIFQTRGS